MPFLSGMSFFEVAIAHSAVQSILMFIQAIEMMIIMYIVYDNPFNGNVLTGLALLLLVGCGGSVFGEYWLEFGWCCRSRDYSNSLTGRAPLNLKKRQTEK